MRIMGRGEGYKVLVEMDTSEWSSLQSASGMGYNERSDKPGAEANVAEINNCLSDYDKLGEFAEDIVKLVNMWKRIKARAVGIGKMKGDKK